MKKNYFLLTVASSLIFMGAGCNFGESKTTISRTEEPVIDTTTQQDAYLFCTQKGYDIQIRYDSAKNKNIAYCVFDKDNECESVAFMQGTCPSSKIEENTLSSMFEPILGDEFPLRLCEPKANPVCGVDNKTYTNGCVAEFLGVKIVKQGSCDREVEPVQTPTQDTATEVAAPTVVKKGTQTIYGGANSGNNTSIVSSKQNEKTPENTWVEIPLSLLQSTAGTNSRIDRCEYNGVTTFFVQDEFPTLYNAKGEAICYPEHDIDNSCPGYINNGAYKSSCKRI